MISLTQNTSTKNNSSLWGSKSRQKCPDSSNRAHDVDVKSSLDGRYTLPFKFADFTDAGIANYTPQIYKKQQASNM